MKKPEVQKLFKQNSSKSRDSSMAKGVSSDEVMAFDEEQPSGVATSKPTNANSNTSLSRVLPIDGGEVKRPRREAVVKKHHSTGDKSSDLFLQDHHDDALRGHERVRPAISKQHTTGHNVDEGAQSDLKHKASNRPTSEQEHKHHGDDHKSGKKDKGEHHRASIAHKHSNSDHDDAHKSGKNLGDESRKKGNHHRASVSHKHSNSDHDDAHKSGKRAH
jgi:hypothetical protein